eukprot:14414928-Alexandrium_andersonii.AAC.1
MSASLVGSEMCIRDRLQAAAGSSHREGGQQQGAATGSHQQEATTGSVWICLLYTSDAADDM